MIGLYLTLLDSETEKNDFEKLYNRYRLQMYAVAHQILNSPEDAEDIVHDVFLEIAKKHLPTLQQMNNEQDVRNYLLAAAKYRAINLIKIRNRYQDDIDPSEDRVHISKSYKEDILEQLIKKQEISTLYKAMEQLTEKDRMILYCYYVLELPPHEIGFILNQKTVTTRKQITRARHKLATFFEGEE